MTCWSEIINDWKDFWNEVRTTWYERFPNKFGAKYNKETKEWLANKKSTILWNSKKDAIIKDVFKVLSGIIFTPPDNFNLLNRNQF